MRLSCFLLIIFSFSNLSYASRPARLCVNAQTDNGPRTRPIKHHFCCYGNYDGKMARCKMASDSIQFHTDSTRDCDHGFFDIFFNGTTASICTSKYIDYEYAESILLLGANTYSIELRVNVSYGYSNDT